MPLDEIGGGLFRLIGWLFWDFCVQLVLGGIGCCVVWLVTFGQVKLDRDQWNEELLACLIGLAAIIGTAFLIARWL